jgi:hypothetical protein
MAEDPVEPRINDDDAVLQQQYLRALSSFEGIVLSQIDVKNRLGDRLNYSIRTGLVILSLLAFAILILLLTLTSQITRISSVVSSMNTHFSAVSLRMAEIADHMVSMEHQVAQMQPIAQYTSAMRDEVAAIQQSTSELENNIVSIGGHMHGSRANVENIMVTMGAMNQEIQVMSAEMHRMAKPARTLNRMFPFP